MSGFLGHVPIGYFELTSFTILNPARSIEARIVSLVLILRPEAAQQAVIIGPQVPITESGGMEPSLQLRSMESSTCSMKPPGAVFLLNWIS